MNNNNEIAKMIAIFVAAYPYAKEVTPQTAKVYAAMLQDIEPNILDQALKMCLTTCKFFPTIAEIREKATEFKKMSVKLPLSGEAWAEVLEKARTIGHVRKPEFSNPIIGKTVECVGGWEYICLSENIMTDRARFLQIYEQLIERNEKELTYLPETINSAQQLNSGKVNDEIKRLTSIIGS